MHSKREYIRSSLSIIEDMIEQNRPLFEIARRLNVKYDTLKKYLKEFGVEYAGNPNRKGIGHPEQRKSLEDVFNNIRYVNASTLRMLLIRDGYKDNKCECCGLSEWNGLPIPLELHHINFNHYDNSLSNLEILCSNCHMQKHGYSNHHNKWLKFWKKVAKNLKKWQ